MRTRKVSIVTQQKRYEERQDDDDSVDGGLRTAYMAVAGFLEAMLMPDSAHVRIRPVPLHSISPTHLKKYGTRQKGACDLH